MIETVLKWLLMKSGLFSVTTNLGTLSVVGHSRDLGHYQGINRPASLTQGSEFFPLPSYHSNLTFTPVCKCESKFLIALNNYECMNDRSDFLLPIAITDGVRR